MGDFFLVVFFLECFPFAVPSPVLDVMVVVGDSVVEVAGERDDEVVTDEEVMDDVVVRGGVAGESRSWQQPHIVLVLSRP